MTPTPRVTGPKFIGGQANSGRLVLLRQDRSTAVCDVVIVKNATLTDNGDSTFDLVFPGS